VLRVDLHLAKPDTNAMLTAQEFEKSGVQSSFIDGKALNAPGIFQVLRHIAVSGFVAPGATDMQWWYYVSWNEECETLHFTNLLGKCFADHKTTLSASFQ